MFKSALCSRNRSILDGAAPVIECAQLCRVANVVSHCDPHDPFKPQACLPSKGNDAAQIIIFPVVNVEANRAFEYRDRALLAELLRNTHLQR